MSWKSPRVVAIIWFVGALALALVTDDWRRWGLAPLFVVFGIMFWRLEP